MLPSEIVLTMSYQCIRAQSTLPISIVDVNRRVKWHVNWSVIFLIINT